MMNEITKNNWSGDWTVIEKVGNSKGRPIEIGHNPHDPYTPYCVQYGGNGHYFKTLDACRAYCRERRWCP